MAKKQDFDSAYEKLEKIYVALQADDLSIEAISKLVKESSELIAYCKDRLRTVESEINEVFEE